MAQDTAISVENVSKIFKLPHEKQSSIKSLLLNLNKRQKGYEQQRALDDVSFEIKKGEFFGIVGRNGSGKSTLLKLLAGIYSPTKGKVEVTGKLTPFIELGVGFNPELTGRENVFLNGALLGFNRKEMGAMYDDIVEFAELSRFMDQKLKNYSSGMQVRLAFSIATKAKSDILVLDEVLAVGDEAFQQKCIDVFENYKAQGQTIVLVTHDMGIVERFCTRAMLIDDGKISSVGSPGVVAREYSKINENTTLESITSRNENVSDQDVDVKLLLNGQPTARFTTGDTVKITLSWSDKLHDVKNVGVGIVKQSGEFIFGANTFDQPHDLISSQVTYETKLDLGPGSYFVMVGLFGEHEGDIKKFIDRGPEFIVRSKKGDISRGLVRLDYKWTK